MSDETTDPSIPKARPKGIPTLMGEVSVAAAAEERRWMGIESSQARIIALLDDLNDEKAIAFAKQEARTRRTEACMKLAASIVQPATLKYVAGVIVLCIGSYAGLSFSGYGVTVGAGDCPTAEAGAVPSDAP